VLTLLFLGALSLTQASVDSTPLQDAVMIVVEWAPGRPLPDAVVEVWNGPRLLSTQTTSARGVVGIPWEVATQASELRLRRIGFQAEVVPVATLSWRPAVRLPLRLESCRLVLTGDHSVSGTNPKLPVCRPLESMMSQIGDAGEATAR